MAKKHKDALLGILKEDKPTNAQIANRHQAIRTELLRDERRLDQPNFSRLSPAVLEFAFDQYDQRFFEGRCRALLRDERLPIEFRLSKRMTRAGGMTVRYEEPVRRTHQMRTRFEIKLSSTLLFQSFRDENDVKVSGCRCSNRLDAMMRIVEHEMIHLLEMLLWYDSSCAKRRFQGIANRLFGHTESTHQLLTPVEVARDEYGISAGDVVTFRFDGKDLAGIVNRITRRATVLVPDARGERYNDGRKYLKYYVPLQSLKRSR